MLEIGINSNNECGQDIKEILMNIRDAGFKNVMIAFKAGNAEESLKWADAIGLKVPFVHFKNSDDLWVKGTTNKEYIQLVKDELDLCKKYGVKIAVLHATSGNATSLALPPNEHGLKCMLEILNHAKKCKVKIALENLDMSSYKHFKYLMDNIQDKNLGFCYDAGHHQLYLPKIDLLKKYGNRILAVHLHSNFMDWEYGYDWSRDMHMLPFDGELDYQKIIKKLAKTPYNNVIMLELHKENYEQYNKFSNAEFLKLAYQQGQKLAEMFENEKLLQKNIKKTVKNNKNL